MGYYITPSSIYYEGDRANINDKPCAQRPSPHHVWDGIGWRLDATSYKAAVKRLINNAANLRIVSYYPLVNQPSPGTQNNMLARKSSLDEVRLTGGTLTPAEVAELQVLKDAWTWIEAVRAAAKTAKLAVDMAANDKASIDAAAVVMWPSTVPPEWPL